MNNDPQEERDPRNVAIGARLRLLRKRGGLSQDELAAAIGENSGTYGRWEQGRHAISVLAAVAIAHRLGCSLDALLDVTKPPHFSVDAARGRVSYIVRRNVLKAIAAATTLAELRKALPPGMVWGVHLRGDEEEVDDEEFGRLLAMVNQRHAQLERRG